eukprot:3640187-Prymnesium_polylepis.1
MGGGRSEGEGDGGLGRPARARGRSRRGNCRVVVVQQRVRVGDAEEEPRETLVDIAEGRLLDKQALEERACRRE